MKIFNRAFFSKWLKKISLFIQQNYLLSILVFSFLLGSLLFYLSWLRSGESNISPVTLYCLENRDSTDVCSRRRLKSKRLYNREIKNVFFTRCVCKNMSLINIKASDSDLRDSRFDRSYLKNVSFFNVDLFKSSFYGAILDNVVFEKTELTGVIFNFVTFRNVYFKNVNLSSTLFIGARFEKTYYDKNTKLPFSKEQASRMGLLLKE